MLEKRHGPKRGERGAIARQDQKTSLIAKKNRLNGEREALHLLGTEGEKRKIIILGKGMKRNILA